MWMNVMIWHSDVTKMQAVWTARDRTTAAVVIRSSGMESSAQVGNSDLQKLFDCAYKWNIHGQHSLWLYWYYKSVPDCGHLLAVLWSTSTVEGQRCPTDPYMWYLLTSAGVSWNWDPSPMPKWVILLIWHDFSWYLRIFRNYVTQKVKFILQKMKFILTINATWEHFM